MTLMVRGLARFLLLPVALAALCAAGAAAADVQLPPGRPLDRALVQQMLVQRLTGGDADEALAVRIDEPALPLVNRASQPITLSLTSLQLDPTTGRFTANLAATLPSGAGSTILVAGAVERLTDVPVLGRPLAAGEIIAAADIVWKRMALPQRQVDTLLDLDAIVGLEARRPLAADRAVRARDVKAPLLVQRGESVSVLYSAAGLEITASGTALEVGRLGEIVQVQNMSSGEVRRGVVEARRRVRVNGLAAEP